jgi:3-dehydroquinate dehydratase
MAEHVQAVLDDMVAPLREMQERGIFSPDEIHSIVQRRRTSEYALRRRLPRKADFLSYLEAEMNLEKLRKLRQNRVKVRSESDKHIQQHIHLLWTRTLRKYRNDVALYLEYAEFCKSTRSHRRLSRLYAQAVQLLPHQAGLWIQAASHEFFQNHSIANARVLMQRAIRMNATSEELWVQSFVLELHFVQKLTGRRTILGGESSFDYSLAKLVFDHAMQKHNKVGLCMQFLHHCRGFPETESLEQHMMDTMQQNGGDKAWMPRIAHAAAKGADCEQVLALIRQATQTVATFSMYLEATRFLSSYSDNVEEKEQCQSLLEELYGEAATLSQQEDSSSEVGILLDHVEHIMVQHDDKEKAKQRLQSFVDQKSKEIPAVVWMKLASMVESKPDAVAVLERGMKQMPMDKSDYMHLLLQMIGAKLEDVKLLERILLLSPGFVELEDIEEPTFGISSIPDACLQCLEYALEHDGLNGARKVYCLVLFQSSGWARSVCRKQDIKVFIERAIDSERSCLSEDRKHRLSRLYQVAIEIFGGTDDGDVFRLMRDQDLVYG